MIEAEAQAIQEQTYTILRRIHHLRNPTLVTNEKTKIYERVSACGTRISSCLIREHIFPASDIAYPGRE
jgi:hypothetical protein